MKIVVWVLTGLMLLGIIYAFSTCRAVESDGRVELSLYDWNYPAYIKMNRERIAIFERENPDIKVRLIGGDEAKYMTMVSGGVAPDVTFAGYGSIPYYAKRDAILSLDDFIAEDKDFSLDDYFPVTVKSARYRGKIYALPDDGSPVAIVYNKDLFDEYNSKHPDKPLTYPGEKWTWDDFRHAAKALTADNDGDGQTDVYGASISFWRNRWPIPVWQNGGEVVSADKKQCLMDSPEAIEAIRWFYEMMWVDKSSPTTYTQIKGVEAGGGIFRQRRLAMGMDARYGYTNLIGKTDFAWDIAPLPKSPTTGKRTSLYLGGVWMISSQTRYPQQAWKLTKFLVGDKSSEMSMQCGRAIAANRAVAERILRNPGASMPEHDYAWIDIMNDSRPKDFDFQEMGRYFTRAMDELQYISQGRRKPEEACRNFTRNFNEGLKILWEKEGGP